MPNVTETSATAVMAASGNLRSVSLRWTEGSRRIRRTVTIKANTGSRTESWIDTEMLVMTTTTA